MKPILAEEWECSEDDYREPMSPPSIAHPPKEAKQEISSFLNDLINEDDLNNFDAKLFDDGSHEPMDIEKEL